MHSESRYRIDHDGHQGFQRLGVRFDFRLKTQVSLYDITATPCSPMVPLREFYPQVEMAFGERFRPSRTTPKPVVVMYTPSMAFFHDFSVAGYDGHRLFAPPPWSQDPFQVRKNPLPK